MKRAIPITTLFVDSFNPTARVMSHYEGVAIPLEFVHILWPR